ncbi:hypothetical protein C8R45DRAFT_1108463 [Mycena sanguinolenta]|nr:hypothetical protein C8R45DRAFT_1108463 [Mycena sanguinolenta]
MFHPQRHLWVPVDWVPLWLIEQILLPGSTSTSRVPTGAAKKTNTVRVVDDWEDDGDDDNQQVWDHAGHPRLRTRPRTDILLVLSERVDTQTARLRARAE